MQHIHLIAIGGSAMHNLAIALKQKGYKITGSDDEIFEPSKSRLNKYNILPECIGWDENRITKDIDAIIVGMHARKDNPELLKARALNLPVFSYPEYLYEQAKGKTRLVICGSHGKTTITAMVLHVLAKCNIDCDYMVGAQLDGFECMVKLSDAPLMILEGDEYLSSPEDPQPKFMHYKANCAVLSGISWDHINVFPTFEVYENQFRLLLEQLQQNKSKLIYNAEDEKVVHLVNQYQNIDAIAYQKPSFIIENGITKVEFEGKTYKLSVFGNHNLQNMSAAQQLCEQAGVNAHQFFEAIQSFTGAAKRLEKVKETPNSVFYKDFAHSPSKLEATTKALKEQFPERELVACMELHTFSSLNKTFLKEYNGSMRFADRAIVFFNPKTIAHKKLEELSEQEVKAAFNSENVEVMTNSPELIDQLKALSWQNKNLLMMSSGNFDGVSFEQLAEELM